MKFSEKLLKLRKRAGLTQDELAAVLDVSRQTISKWELGTSYPDTANFLRLSQYFSVSVEALINDESELEIEFLSAQAAPALTKHSYWRTKKRLVFAICVPAFILILGVLRNSLSSALLAISIIAALLLFYYVLKNLYLYAKKLGKN